jgi:hypothetical protein
MSAPCRIYRRVQDLLNQLSEIGGAERPLAELVQPDHDFQFVSERLLGLLSRSDVSESQHHAADAIGPGPLEHDVADVPAPDRPPPPGCSRSSNFLASSSSLPSLNR